LIVLKICVEKCIN